MILAFNKKEIRKEILNLMVPTVLENILQMLASMVITAMVGRLLADEISAQGISNRIYSIAFALFRGIGMGVTVVVALYFGAQERQRCRRVVEQAYLSVTPLALLFTVVIFLFPTQLLSVLTDDPALLRMAVDYTKITVFAIPFMAITGLNTAAFHGHRDTRTPMLIAICLNVVNIGVGYVAIFGVGGFGGMGIQGAAIATVFAQVAGAVAGIIILYRRKGLLRQVSHGFGFFQVDKAAVREIFATGIPAAMENLFWQFSAIIMSRVILSYSSDHYAAYQLGLQAEMLTEMPAMGFVTASTTLAAKAIGQRSTEMFKAYYKNIIQMAGIVAVAASAALFLLPRFIMALLTDKVVLQQLGASYVFLMGFAQIPQVLSKVYHGVIRASGGKRIPMYFSFLGIWGIRVPLTMLAGWVLHLDIRFIWAIIAVDQTARMLMCLVYIRRKNVLQTVERLKAQDSMLHPQPISQGDDDEGSAELSE